MTSTTATTLPVANVITVYDPKPIPMRNFDWSAYDQDTYCGCADCHCPVGFGCTEAEAIQDLKDQTEDD